MYKLEDNRTIYSKRFRKRESNFNKKSDKNVIKFINEKRIEKNIGLKKTNNIGKWQYIWIWHIVVLKLELNSTVKKYAINKIGITTSCISYNIW